MKTFLRDWGPAIAWAGVISLMSAKYFAAERTSHFILPIVNFLFPHADAEQQQRIHLFIRKFGHVFEYSVFGLLVLRGIRHGRREWRWTWAIVALAMSGAMGLLDELHQAFVPGRTATPWDSLIDTCGAAGALLLAWALIKIRATRPEITENSEEAG